MKQWLRHISFLSLGLAVGAGLGVYLGWVAWPTEYTEAAPVILQENYRRDYVLMIATAYSIDHDLETAQARITTLGPNGRDYLFSLMLDTILAEGDEAEIRQLVQLAHDLGLSSPAMTPYLPDPDL